MSLSEDREVLLSQLADGELPVDQANQVLADVLSELDLAQDGAAAARQLHAMLQLRQTFAPWRRQECPRSAAALPSACEGVRAPRGMEWASGWLSLAAAAMLGGILVAGGFYLGGQLRRDGAIATTDQPSRDGNSPPRKASDALQPVVIVTPEQRSEIARAFALHESVVGPLSWYAADESTIQVAPAQAGEKPAQPIAIVLRLMPTGCQPSEAKTYTIVCRDNNPTIIELPRSASVRSAHLRLLSAVTGGRVSLQYALAADLPQDGPGQSAALVGSRHLSLGQVPLGQLALDDCLVNVDASAWTVPEAGKNGSMESRVP